MIFYTAQPMMKRSNYSARFYVGHLEDKNVKNIFNTEYLSFRISRICWKLTCSLCILKFFFVWKQSILNMCNWIHHNAYFCSIFGSQVHHTCWNIWGANSATRSYMYMTGFSCKIKYSYWWFGSYKISWSIIYLQIKMIDYFSWFFHNFLQ